MLAAELPPGLAGVDCQGNETSLLQCPVDSSLVQFCSITASNASEATVLACGESPPGVLLYMLAPCEPGIMQYRCECYCVPHRQNNRG